MTDKELLDKAICWFKMIADDMEHITSGNVSHQSCATKGRAIQAYEFIEKHRNSLPEEPVSEELEEAAIMHYKDVMEYESKTGLKPAYMTSFKAGAQWQKENLWKPADGEDLPIIDREVIALLDNGKVVFAHRPPEYWDGKNIITGKVTRYYPKTYDKGGWNIPDVKYWLDCQIPNIED